MAEVHKRTKQESTQRNGYFVLGCRTLAVDHIRASIFLICNARKSDINVVCFLHSYVGNEESSPKFHVHILYLPRRHKCVCSDGNERVGNGHLRVNWNSHFNRSFSRLRRSFSRRLHSLKEDEQRRQNGVILLKNGY